jgi:uncharacterized membrane protein YkoI
MLEHDEARQVWESGQVMTREELERIAAERHPGGPGALGSQYGEDEETPGRYLAAVEVEDGSGAVWDMELDARTGELLEETSSED